MKEITWSQFKQLTAASIKAGECLKVVADGEVVGYFVVRPVQDMEREIVIRCGMIDKARGFRPEPEKPTEVKVPDLGELVDARHWDSPTKG